MLKQGQEVQMEAMSTWPGMLHHDLAYRMEDSEIYFEYPITLEK